ncbi:hypothetical protein BDZ88DRAFT_455631 [Geranomyces variabilis]|nr:hypothetical protein BDZ88DRAFT_455631 [Geranomyces variabilis]KAJ3131643.1 hypothetical protein HDU90_008165 [Geranomyces variabilis]
MQWSVTGTLHGVQCLLLMISAARLLMLSLPPCDTTPAFAANAGIAVRFTASAVRTNRQSPADLLVALANGEHVTVIPTAGTTVVIPTASAGFLSDTLIIDSDWVIEKLPIDDLSTDDFIHIRELDPHRIGIILKSLQDRQAYEQLKPVIVAANAAESPVKYSILDGAHRVAAVKKYNKSEAKKITHIPAVVLGNDISLLDRALLATALNSATQATSKDKFTDQMTTLATFQKFYVQQHGTEPSHKELAELAVKGGMR